MKRTLVWLLWQINVWGTILATRLVQWTGKSPHPIHPKHFLGTEWQRWYLPHIQPADVILDAGCGNGKHTIACAQCCRAAYGFDYAHKHLQTGRAEAHREGTANILLSQGTIEAPWSYPDEPFDAVMILDVLEHLQQRDFALQEARRVLRPGGRLLVSVPQRTTSWKQLRASVELFPYADLDHKIEYTQAEIEQELAQNGFICESAEPIVYDTPWAGMIDLVGGFSLRLYRRLARWKREMALKKPAESSGFRIVARKGSDG